MNSVFSAVANLNGGGIRFGTAATRNLLNKLGSPDNDLKIIHVAGTNGKGSTAEYISRVLIAAGKRTGTFTSPMVQSFFDQFKINGNPMEEQILAPYFSAALAAADGATSFEVQTAAALAAFLGEGCEYAVVECGMGGKYDATNAINHKLVAVISSIGLEHTAVLGGTYAQICAHKAGIIQNCPAVVNALQPREVRQYFAPLGVIFADNGLKILHSGIDEQEFLYGAEHYRLRMPGTAQVYNAAAAIEVAKLLNIDKRHIYSGLLQARLAGRLQILHSRGNTYIVDGGHNPDGVAPLAELLGKFSSQDVTLIFGSLSDKDINGVLTRLSGLASRVYSVRPPSPRSSCLNTQTAVCKKYFAAVEQLNSVTDALKKASGVVAVCGTFTFLKEALNWIENE